MSWFYNKICVIHFYFDVRICSKVYQRFCKQTPELPDLEYFDMFDILARFVDFLVNFGCIYQKTPKAAKVVNKETNQRQIQINVKQINGDKI